MGALIFVISFYYVLKLSSEPPGSKIITQSITYRSFGCVNVNILIVKDHIIFFLS